MCLGNGPCRELRESSYRVVRIIRLRQGGHAGTGVTQRGNNAQDVFFAAEARGRAWALLEQLRHRPACIVTQRSHLARINPLIRPS